jgi:hypothetical protein
MCGTKAQYVLEYRDGSSRGAEPSEEAGGNGTIRYRKVEIS